MKAPPARSTRVPKRPEPRKTKTHPTDHEPKRTFGANGAVLLVIVVVLNAIGLVMVLSASSVHSLQAYGTSWLFFKRQVIWVLIGAGSLAGVSRVDYRKWARLGIPMLAVTVALLVAVLMPGLGVAVNGSSRWLRAGPLSLQPSELGKLALILFGAGLLSQRADRMGETRVTMRPVLVVFGLLALLVMKQPDMGTTIVLTTIAFVLVFVSGTPMKPLVKIAASFAVLGYLAARLEPYRWARMASFRDPFADVGNSGYQLAQSLVGLGSGGLTGLGLGASRAKWGFLPNAHTDFIFAILGEELGLIGSLLIVALFLSFAVVGIRIALRAPDRFGMLVAAGITAWVAGQAFLNIGVVIGALPVTGVPLPFLSFGGSSLVFTMVATGILLNIAAQARVPATTR
ncbi:MAG: cell division protein FtsW [Actinomycetota bacterium]|jgi:cell division protein FtsW